MRSTVSAPEGRLTCTRYRAGGSGALVAGCLALCVVMDFFLPWRDAVSGLEFILVVALWLVVAKGSLTRIEILALFLITYYLAIAINWMRGGELYLLAKLALYPLVFEMMYQVGRRLGRGRIRVVAKTYLAIFSAAFAINVLVSVHLGLYGDRRLWAFAHVDLTGAYVAGTVVPLSFVLATDQARHTARRLLLVVEAIFTRSSGGLLASLLILVDARRLHLRTILWVFLAMAIVVGGALGVGAAFNTSYYSKLRDAADVFRSGQTRQLWELAKHRQPLSELGQAGEGSLTWRFYAYAVYADALASEPPMAILLGSGAGSYKKVWQGYMPHNDFILILHDFGAVAEFAFLLGLVYFGWRIRRSPIWLAALAVLILCLLVENNIYSAWLMISWLTWIGLALGGHVMGRK